MPGVLVLVVNRARGLPQALGRLVTPRCPPMPLQPRQPWLSAAPYLLQVRWCCPWPMVPRGDQSRRELGKSFSSKQDPYLGAACVGRAGAEGLVPAPRGTRVLPAERWGCPAAGQARATQLCPQPCVRLSRNGGSLHGGEGAGQPRPPKPRGCRGCLRALCCSLRGAGPLESLAAAL